jgi:hypothetical protein
VARHPADQPRLDLGFVDQPLEDALAGVVPHEVAPPARIACKRSDELALGTRLRS